LKFIDLLQDKSSILMIKLPLEIGNQGVRK